MTEVGVDTWRHAWYSDPHLPWFRRFRATCVQPSRLGGRLLPHAVAGHRIGCYENGMIFAEGHPVEGRLASAAELVPAALSLQEAMIEQQVPISWREMRLGRLSSESVGYAGVRRLDTTVNIAFADGVAGLGVLAGVAAVVRDSPGQLAEYYNGRRKGSVYLKGYAGKRSLGRFYDKASESAVGAPGTLIRGEDQRRWPRELARGVDELSGVELRDAFQRRFRWLWTATRGVKVCGPFEALDRILELHEDGDIETAAQAHKLVAAVVCEARGRTLPGSRTTVWRLQRQLRELGIVVGSGLDEVDVDLHSVMEAVMQSPLWG